MADKKDSKPAPAPSLGAFEMIIVVILVVGLAGAAINSLSRYQGVWTSFIKTFPYYIVNFFAKYAVFSFFISVVLFILLIIYLIRENKIRKKIMSKVLPPSGEKAFNVKDVVIENPKWKLVEAHINSDDASKWRLAILEADIILNEILETLNLPGEGIGEKLRNVEASDFDHLDEAWEAHKIRNAIAHEGSDFLLTQREAKRVIRLYKSVFEEFEII